MVHAFPVYSAQAPGCSAGELSNAGPGLCVLPRSKLLRFRFSHLHKYTDLVGPAFCALPRSAAQVTRCLSWAPSSVDYVSESPPWSQPLSFLGVQRVHHLRCVVCLLWGADLRLQPSWWMSTVQDPRKTWLATGSLLTIWWRMHLLGGDCHLPSVSGCHPICLSASSKGGGGSQPASSLLVFTQSVVL